MEEVDELGDVVAVLILESWLLVCSPALPVGTPLDQGWEVDVSDDSNERIGVDNRRILEIFPLLRLALPLQEWSHGVQVANLLPKLDQILALRRIKPVQSVVNLFPIRAPIRGCILTTVVVRASQALIE